MRILKWFIGAVQYRARLHLTVNFKRVQIGGGYCDLLLTLLSALQHYRSVQNPLGQISINPVCNGEPCIYILGAQVQTGSIVKATIGIRLRHTLQ